MQTRKNPTAKSILEMARGGILERADCEMQAVAANIRDVNTPAAKKRTIIIQIDVLPDADRQNWVASIHSKSKLQPMNPITTTLYDSVSPDGERVTYELTAQIPGQQDIFGGEQEPPAVLRMA